jgi:predicted RNA-binding Zn ribbon-like protein
MVKRPLTGEPLPLDLLNTTWMQGGVMVDLLDTEAGVQQWLTEHGFDDTPSPDRIAPTLRVARDAMRRSLLRPGEAAAHDALNALLARGHLRQRIGPGGPEAIIEIDDETWLVAWRAADELVELLTQKRSRIRQCGSLECVLWFLDTTRSATRRWCSMDGCGNRNKVRQHRSRTMDESTTTQMSLRHNRFNP